MFFVFYVSELGLSPSNLSVQVLESCPISLTLGQRHNINNSFIFEYETFFFSPQLYYMQMNKV